MTVEAAEGGESLPAAADSEFRRRLSEFFRSPLAAIGAVVFASICLAALFAPWITPQNPHDLASLSFMDGRLPPGSVGMDGTVYLLGTDDQGRDMLSAILYGLRISLTVGLVSSLSAMLIGTMLGLLAGYKGGGVDSVIMRLVDFQLSVPALLMALMLLALLGRGEGKIILALAAVQWTYFARTARASALVERRKDYMEAARCLALGSGRQLFRHLLPNCMPPLTVVLMVEFAHAIALEATLSFLGVGLPITQPSLGLLISNGFQFVLNGQQWISLYPGLALLVTVFSINLVGDRLRDVLNPRMER